MHYYAQTLYVQWKGIAVFVSSSPRVLKFVIVN